MLSEHIAERQRGDRHLGHELGGEAGERRAIGVRNVRVTSALPAAPSIYVLVY